MKSVCEFRFGTIRMWRIIWCFVIIFLPCRFVQAQDYTLYQNKFFISDTDTLPYRILSPFQEERQKKYPLLIFFDGAALRGNDNIKQPKHGADLFLNPEIRKEYPAYIVVPQCPADSSWVDYQVINDSISSRHFDTALNSTPTTPMKLAMKLIAQLVQGGHIDRNRIYVGGQSLGGLATFDILWRQPEYFAAAFPIAGAGSPEVVKDYNQKTAVWIFHGEQDHVVPYINSLRMYKEMKRQNMNAKYTLYPKAKHNSWDSVFAETDLIPWIFSRHR